MSAGLGRRDFLRLGVAGGAVLAAGSSLAVLSGCAPSSVEPAPGYRHLRAADVRMLVALMPVVMAGNELAEANPEAPVKAIDALLDGNSPAGRKQYRQLLDLLSLGAVRWYFTGHWAAFQEQDPESLHDAVTQWSRSDSGFARLALRGLVVSGMMAWYSITDVGKSIGYPGPPRKIA